MIKNTSFSKAKEIILQSTNQHDLAIARRIILLEILWHEHYLTRAQLIIRGELKLGKDCFGISAWKDTFYRDMHVVWQAFKSAGYVLSYSRNKQQPGYYLEGQSILSPEFKKVLNSSAAEVDQCQIDIYHRLSPTPTVA
jgi:hypothetical protein